jgi:hypothetical protein
LQKALFSLAEQFHIFHFSWEQRTGYQKEAAMVRYSKKSPGPEGEELVRVNQSLCEESNPP